MANFKIGQHYDHAFKTMQPQEVTDNLEAIAYGVTETSYTKNLSEEEIIERKDEYSEISIKLSEIQKQKKDEMDRFKAMAKEPSIKAGILLDSIKFKSEQKYGKLYLVDDQEEGFMYSFDENGICVDARPLLKSERQTKLRTVKTASNE